MYLIRQYMMPILLLDTKARRRQKRKGQLGLRLPLLLHLPQGEALGLSSTPGFFINGREVRGAQPLEAFVSVIDEELRGARR